MSAAIAILATAVVIWAVLSFPFEPSLMFGQKLLVSVALALFSFGVRKLLLSRRSPERIRGMRIAVVAAGLVLPALRPEPSSWWLILVGCAVAIGMSMWGCHLFGIHAACKSEHRKS